MGGYNREKVVPTVLKAHSLDAGNGLDNGGLSVSDMADCAYINSGLSSDDFGRCGGQRGDIEIFGICLRGQRWSLLSYGFQRYLLCFCLGLNLRLRLRLRTALGPRVEFRVIGFVDRHGRKLLSLSRYLRGRRCGGVALFWRS